MIDASKHRQGPVGPPSDSLGWLRNCLNREIDLLDDRARMFLTFDSLLITAFAFGRTSFALAIIIPLLGLVTTVLWLYLGHRTLLMYSYFRNTLKHYESKLAEEDRIFTNEENYREHLHRPLFGIRLSTYFGYGLPLILVMAWLALLVLNPNFGFS